MSPIFSYCFPGVGDMCHILWQGGFTHNRKQVVNRLKIPRVSPHYCFTGGVKFPQGEGSAVIHRKKNDLFYEDANCLCHSLVLWLSPLCSSALVSLAPWIFSE